MRLAWRITTGLVCSLAALVVAQESIQRYPYFGDLHVHTSWSLDAYIIFNRTTPADAYRFARGGEIEFYGGLTRKLAHPLDFAAVTEHAEFLGEMLLCSDPSSAAYRSQLCTEIRNEQQDPVIENRIFRKVLLKILTAEKPQRPAFCGQAGQDCRRAARSRWQEVRRIADEYYRPGEFTTFVGYEWTGERNGNRHRNVIFRNNTVPATPWSMIEVPTVEQLWKKLDQDCTAPCEFLTISHNSNQSRGVRFAGVNSAGAPFSREQARYRAAREPLAEIMQFKGESECRTGLGTEDEFCNFEKYDLRPLCPGQPGRGSNLSCVPVCDAPDQPPGCVSPFNYVRNGLKSGLEFQQRLGANPYKLGLLGSTDVHNANPGDSGEYGYRGHFGYLDAAVADRLLPALKTGFKQLPRNPGALTGVWAEANTRDSIFAALRRRETFGTSGNRILLRFFGGWDFPAEVEQGTDLAELGYRTGVPMGADLPQPVSGGSPHFLVWALQAVDGEKLQRLQVVKGWLEDGIAQERVYDVACADGMVADATSHRCPDNGARVNLSNCSVTPERGATQLQSVWEDPDFDNGAPAFYYLRVLENPRCRWSTLDALSLGRPPPTETAPTIQERAWSSPIWYTAVSSADGN